MKKIIYSFLGVALLSTFGSCAREELFGGEDAIVGEATFQKASLSVDLNDDETLVRAAARPDVEDFNVEFFINGEDKAAYTYRYRDMPEVVTLKVLGESSDYVVRASYGENPVAAWESPYYAGESSFTIKPNEIATDVEPIVCKLANIKTTIKFDEGLTEVMSSDSKVTVEVGDSGVLDFTKDDEDKSGYFAYVPNTSDGTSSTLVATFIGTVSGLETVQTKSHQDLKPGNHYLITFRLKSADEEDPGNVNGMVSVDATVQRVDSNGNVSQDEDLLDDDLRPNQGGNGGGSTTNPPTPPVTGGDAPQITASSGVLLDTPNQVANLNGKPVELYIKSDSGISEFKVNISTTDTDLFGPACEDLFNGMDIDMCNPGASTDNLINLGLLKDPRGVKGEKSVTFSVTDFMEMIAEFPGTHTFTLTVKDADGTTVKKLIISVP